MNSFSNNIYSADRVNQSVAMLGGATAQSYGVVGLNKPAVDTAPVAVVQELIANGPNVDLIHFDSDSATAAFKPFVDSSSLLAMLSAPVGVALDEQFEPAVFSQTATVEGSELMSRYELIETEFPVPFGFGIVQNPAVVDVDVLPEGSTTNASSSLLSFIEEVIAQAQASQVQFNNSLDDGRQGFVRESIDSLGSEIRAVLPINDALELAITPIGSFSLPPLGSTLANSQDEIASFTS